MITPPVAPAHSVGDTDRADTSHLVRFVPAVPYAITGAILSLAEIGGPDRNDTVRLALNLYLGGEWDEDRRPSTGTPTLETVAA